MGPQSRTEHFEPGAGLRSQRCFQYPNWCVGCGLLNTGPLPLRFESPYFLPVFAMP